MVSRCPVHFSLLSLHVFSTLFSQFFHFCPCFTLTCVFESQPWLRVSRSQPPPQTFWLAVAKDAMKFKELIRVSWPPSEETRRWFTGRFIDSDTTVNTQSQNPDTDGASVHRLTPAVEQLDRRKTMSNNARMNASWYCADGRARTQAKPLSFASWRHRRQPEDDRTPWDVQSKSTP